MKEYVWNKRVSTAGEKPSSCKGEEAYWNMSCIFFCFFSFTSSSSFLLHYYQQTSSNIVLKKKKSTFHLLSITLGVFYYFTVVMYEYIYIHLIRLIYIFIIVDNVSLSLIFFLFIDMVQNDYFHFNVYLYGEKEKKEVVWSHSFDTIGRHHFRQQYITDEKATIWLFLNI